MKLWMCKKWFIIPIYISILGLPTVATAHSSGPAADNEGNIEIELFSTSDSKSSIGNTQVGTSGLLVETEYELNNMIFSFNYERWNYSWSNPENLPFASGITGDPWSTFNTLQFGFAYEQELNNRWEFNYYLEAESSYEKETSGSREYEAGVDFIYEPSKNWTYTFNVNYEYLDAEGGEIGVDVGIEWNHDTKEGWSGEIELSSEFPEMSLRYHFTQAFSTSIFYNESGTNTIRLSDSSPVPGMQGGYFEDEYNSLGVQLDYEFTPKRHLSFRLQQNSGRTFNFLDKSGTVGTVYEFGDSVEAMVKYSHEF